MNKRSIVALAATLAAGISIVACGRPATTVVSNGNPADEAIYMPQPTALVQTDERTADEVMLDGIQSSTQMLINQYMMASQPVPEYLFGNTQAIEKARQALRDLEGQRTATGMLINQYLMITGEPVPDYVYETVQSIEQSRQEILKGIGFAEPAPTALEVQSIPPVTVDGTPEEVVGQIQKSSEEVLDDMRQSTQELIGALLMSGQPVPDYEYAALRSIDDALEALRQLDAQRQEVVMWINAGPVGEVPEDLMTELDRIVQMRQAILARLNLAD